MRTIAQKQNQPQKPVSSNLTRSNTTALGSHHRVDSILHLQRTIGNQAVQRMLQTHAEELEVGSTSTAASRFAHDFSRIPVHAPVAGTTQAKLTFNTPGDNYEQEADAVAEQVMRMPTPLALNVQQQTEAEKLIQRKITGDAQVQTVPSIAHEVSRSSGQPLDVATRAFMERRFGHDFSRVRVHLDSQATASARDVDALAYTVGRDIVFAHGQFAPHTASGQRLLAHELAHTLQQGVAAEQVITGDLRVGQQDDPFEHEAEKVSTSVLSARVGVASEKPPSASVRPDARPALRRQLPPTLPKKEEGDLTKTPPVAPVVVAPAGSTGQCSPATGGSTGLCSPQGVGLEKIKAMVLQMKDPLTGLILGLTQSLGGGTVSALSTKPAANPQKWVLETITATPSCCSSFYTLAGTYLDTVIPEKGATYERTLIIKTDGEKKIFEAEKEHCDDLKYAFDISLGHYKDVVNDLAKRKVEFVSQDAAEKEVTRRVGREPATWAKHYSDLLERTKIRDKKFWHTVGGRSPGIVNVDLSGARNPKTGNPIALKPFIVDKDSFPEVGKNKHPTPDVIK